jgi:hypothetical protein
MQDEFVNSTCKPLTTECCRFLGMSAHGWQCLKLTELAQKINQRVAAGTFRATGDNCPGVKNDPPIRDAWLPPARPNDS